MGSKENMTKACCLLIAVALTLILVGVVCAF